MICKDVRSGTGLLGSVMLQLIAVVLLSTLGDADLTGEYLSPAGCVAPNCDYTAKWSLDQSTDEILFTITAKQPEGTWTAIAFGPTMSMENQDTIYGYVDTAGASHVVDAYVGAQYTRPVTDAIQNLTSPNIAYANGIYTMTFKRKRVTGDTAGDVNFTDQATLYFKYPVGGGPMQGSTPQKHTSTPKVSPTMVCVCAAPTSPMALPTTTMTPTMSSATMTPSSPVAASTTVMGPSTSPSPPPSGPSMPPSGPSMPPSGPSPPPSPPPSGPSMPPSGPSMPPSGPSPPPSPPPSGPSPPPSPPPSGPSMPPSGPSMPPSGPPPSGPSPPPSPPPSGPSPPPSSPPSGPSMPPSGTGGTSPMPTGTATLGSSSRTRTATIVAAVVAFVVLGSIICLFACCFLPERNIAIQRI